MGLVDFEFVTVSDGKGGSSVFPYAGSLLISIITHNKHVSLYQLNMLCTPALDRNDKAHTNATIWTMRNNRNLFEASQRSPIRSSSMIAIFDKILQLLPEGSAYAKDPTSENYILGRHGIDGAFIIRKSKSLLPKGYKIRDITPFSSLKAPSHCPAEETLFHLTQLLRPPEPNMKMQPLHCANSSTVESLLRKQIAHPSRTPTPPTSPLTCTSLPQQCPKPTSPLGRGEPSLLLSASSLPPLKTSKFCSH